MKKETIKLVIPFETLADAVSELSLQHKHRLWKMLYEQLEQADEDLLEQDPIFRAEIEQARQDFETGDYLTLEEFKSQLGQIKD